MFRLIKSHFLPRGFSRRPPTHLPGPRWSSERRTFVWHLVSGGSREAGWERAWLIHGLAQVQGCREQPSPRSCCQHELGKQLYSSYFYKLPLCAAKGNHTLMGASCRARAARSGGTSRSAHLRSSPSRCPSPPSVRNRQPTHLRTPGSSSWSGVKESRVSSNKYRWGLGGGGQRARPPVWARPDPVLWCP